MKKGLILLILVLPVVAFGKHRYRQLKLPVSRWREVKRMSIDSAVQAFTDTLYISIRRKDSFSYHNSNGFIYNGAYTISEDSILDFGTARFKVSVKRPTMLVLEDDKNIHEMGVDNSDTVKTIVIEKEDSSLPVRDIDRMIGDWTVYKKVTNKQAEDIDFSTEIKSVYITGPSSSGKQGFVYGGLDASNYPSWYIKGLGTDQTFECEGKSLRIIRVLRCQEGEMILEDGDIKYYLKQFK